MLTCKLVSGFRTTLVLTIITRNKGTATDPVQQLFLDKIREYRQKSPDGQFVEPSPVIVKELTKELEKLEKHYGGGPGVDMSAFPTFKFEEPKLDPIEDVIPDKVKGKGKGKDTQTKKTKPDPKTEPKKK